MHASILTLALVLQAPPDESLDQGLDDIVWDELPEPEGAVDAPTAPTQSPEQTLPPDTNPKTPSQDPQTVEPAPELLQPATRSSRPRARRHQKGEPLFHGTTVGPLIGAGRRTLGLGVGVTHFVRPFLAVGLDLMNLLHFGPENFYEFQLTPTVTVLLLPRRIVTPVFWGGFGLDAFSHDLGTYGRWVGGGGIATALGRRIVATIGVEADGREPVDRWKRRLTCPVTSAYCSLGVGPVLGIRARI